MQDRAHVTLKPLQAEDREQFVSDNQEAFLYGATQEFGMRDDHFEEDGQIISRATIEASIDGPGNEAYRIMDRNESVGGLVLHIDPETLRGELELLFVSPPPARTARALARRRGSAWRGCTPRSASGSW